MRGVSLPINALIIIVIAIIVLIAATTFYYKSVTNPQESMVAQTALNDACLRLRSTNCSRGTETIFVYDFDADRDGNFDPGPGRTTACPAPITQDNLFMLCYCHFQIQLPVEENCKKLCQC